MAIVSETICDHCGARKQQSNHWWKLELGVGWAKLSTSSITNGYRMDLCSENCVMIKLSEFMSAQVEEQKAERMEN